MCDPTNRISIDDQATIVSATARRNLIRHPVPTRRIQVLTAETRVNRVQAATYHNYTEQWIRFQTRYHCDCGRQIGFQLQEALVGQPPIQVDEDVISLHSTPPASIADPNISDGSAIVIDDSTDSSSLLEERVGYVPPEPEASDVSSISPDTVVTSNKSSESPDEPMC